ncbi:MAG: cytochrome P450 [Pseudomonadota bacterium]
MPATTNATIPAAPAWPVVGNSLEIVRDCYGFHGKQFARFGSVYRSQFFGAERVNLYGADAVETVLMDKNGIFSSKSGWSMVEGLFGGGLMLRDFSDHRAHRRMLQPAFRAGAMRDYLSHMSREVEARLDAWPVGQEFRFFWQVRALTLSIASRVFMGIEDEAECKRLGALFLAELDASASPIRAPLPLTPMRKGINARAELRRTFKAMIPERRAGQGEDIFSEFCRLTDEEGRHLSDDEIVDHFNFLLFAAFDTTTTALTAMMWGMVDHPEWQDAVAAEVATLEDRPLTYDDLDRMTVTDRVFKEALRLMPPVPFIPRGVTEEFEWEGHRIAAGSSVTVAPGLVMMDPEFWTDPERFDPDRFSSNRAEDQSHRFAWSPFGGGAHKCIGMHFSLMEVKAVTAAFFRRFRISRARPGPTAWQRLPIPQPKDGLPVNLRRVAA